MHHWIIGTCLSLNLDTFRGRLEAWAAKKLRRYDDDENFRKRRNKRYESRNRYEEWLKSEIALSINDVTKLLQSDDKQSA